MWYLVAHIGPTDHLYVLLTDEGSPHVTQDALVRVTRFGGFLFLELGRGLISDVSSSEESKAVRPYKRKLQSQRQNMRRLLRDFAGADRRKTTQRWPNDTMEFQVPLPRFPKWHVFTVCGADIAVPWIQRQPWRNEPFLHSRIHFPLCFSWLFYGPCSSISLEIHASRDEEFHQLAKMSDVQRWDVLHV